MEAKLQAIAFHSKLKTLIGDVIVQGRITVRDQDCLLVSMPPIEEKKALQKKNEEKEQRVFWELLNLPMSTRHSKVFQYAYLHNSNGRKCGAEECQGDAIALGGWPDECRALLCQDHLEAEIGKNGMSA
jgi:hypothetical protein